MYYLRIINDLKKCKNEKCHANEIISCHEKLSEALKYGKHFLEMGYNVNIEQQYTDFEVSQSDLEP